MRASIFFGALLVLLSTSLAHAGGGGKLPFTKDTKAAFAEAKKKGMPSVVYFTADW